MKTVQTKNDISGIFLKMLRDHESSFAHIYFHLFSINKDILEWQLNYLYNLFIGKDEFFKADGKDNWFFIWHKSIRQTDYFTDCFKSAEVRLISEKEEKELRHLRYIYAEGKSKEGENGELFNPEYKRLLELSELKRREKRQVNIGGHLDSILWNTVDADTDNVIREVFHKTFKKIKESND